MGNPLLSMFGQPKSQNQPQNQPNTLFGLFNTIRNSQNPNQAMQNMLFNDPQFKNIVDYINQNGGDARTAFYNMAAQKGAYNAGFNPFCNCGNGCM